MIVNCVIYKNGKKIGDVPVDEISSSLNEPGVFIWVAVRDPEAEEMQKMSQVFNLHHLSVEDVIHGNQRPKIEEYGDDLFLAMHAFEVIGDVPPLPVELSKGEVYIFAGKNYILSVRVNHKKGFAEVRERCEKEPHLLKLGPGFVLYAILDAIVDRYFPLVEVLEDELAKIEEQIFAQDQPKKNIEALYGLKQKILMLRHASASLLEATGKLHGGRVPTICVNTQEYYRDIVDHLHRINLSIDNVREMLITAIQVNLTMISLNEGKVSKKLAGWAAILAMPTMIAGIYGMNFKHMPELESPWGYPAIMIIMITIDIYLYIRFKKAEWI